MLIADAVIRLRNMVNDKPYGVSRSAASPATTVVANPAPKLKVAFGSGTPVEVGFSSAGANTAAIIAGRLQAAIRAAVPADMRFAFATVTYTNGLYTVKSGAFGEDATLNITEGATNDVSAALKLGAAYGGTEQLEPAMRYSDNDLETFINYGINAWNNSVGPDKQVALATMTDVQLTPILYQAWIMVLESDAGAAVYSYRQSLGGDTMDLSEIFRNILDLLRYLRDQLGKMKEDLGIGQVFVSELTRYDRLSDMRAPVYAKSQMPRPSFLQLAKVTATSVLLEWQSVRMPDFARVLIYSSPTGGLVDVSQQTEQSSTAQAGAVRADAVPQGQFTNPLTTVHTIRNLAAVKQYFVIVFQDSRGLYYYSDEFSLDLTQPNPQPVREATNEYPH